MSSSIRGTIPPRQSTGLQQTSSGNNNGMKDIKELHLTTEEQYEEVTLETIGDIKKPMRVAEIKEVLGVHELPNLFKGVLTYRETDLSKMFIGFYKQPIGDRGLFKSVTKRVTMKSRGIELPVYKNNRKTMSWEINEDDLTDVIVFILSVEEEFFTTSVQDSVKNLQLGIFQKEEVIEYIRKENTND